MTYGIFSAAIGKTGHKVEIDFESLPEQSQRYLIEYGLKQSMNDCRSGEPDAKKAIDLVERKLAALVSGSLRIVGRTGMDDVATEIVAMFAPVAFPKLGTTKAKEVTKIKEVGFDQWFIDLCEKHSLDSDAITAKAEENIEARKLQVASMGDLLGL